MNENTKVACASSQWSILIRRIKPGASHSYDLSSHSSLVNYLLNAIEKKVIYAKLNGRAIFSHSNKPSEHHSVFGPSWIHKCHSINSCNYFNVTKKCYITSLSKMSEKHLSCNCVTCYVCCLQNDQTDLGTDEDAICKFLYKNLPILSSKREEYSFQIPLSQ